MPPKSAVVVDVGRRLRMPASVLVICSAGSARHSFTEAAHHRRGLTRVVVSRRHRKAGGREPVAAGVVVALTQVDRQCHAQRARGAAVPVVIAPQPADRPRSTKTSLRLPSTALAARRRSSIGMSMVSSRRPRPRSSMTGDSGDVAGASARAIERVVRADRSADADWMRTACVTARVVVPGSRGTRRRGRVGGCARANRASSPSVVNDSGAGAAGTPRRTASGASRVRSTRCVEQFHAADAVGERVVHLHCHRRALAVGSFESFEERELPERARPVEARCRDRLQRVEQRALASRRGQPRAPEVEVEVERLLDRPARWSHPERRRDHPLAKSRDQQRSAFDALAQPIPVGNGIEERNRENRRAKDRVLFDVPHRPRPRRSCGARSVRPRPW